MTVHLEKGHAPTLEMRFSGLDMPSPAVLAENINSRPRSELFTSASSSVRSGSWGDMVE